MSQEFSQVCRKAGSEGIVLLRNEKQLLTLLSRMCAGELSVAETQTLSAACWEKCLEQEVSYEP